MPQTSGTREHNQADVRTFTLKECTARLVAHVVAGGPLLQPRARYSLHAWRKEDPGSSVGHGDDQLVALGGGLADNAGP